jgi:RNA polymerase sigma-70 factor (ECF subfamily)
LPDDLEVAAESDAGELTAADRERLAEVHEAIGRLPDRQREILVLRMLLGQSTEETAQTLGCPEGTVKSNLHKAVGNLRAMVAQSEAIDEMRSV